MKNYSLKNALVNILTNKRGHYYGLMLITAILAYFGTIIASVEDMALQALLTTIVTLVSGMVQEAIDYNNDIK